MPIISVPNAGSIGVNKDLSNSELPVGAWTDAQNIRFLDGYAHQSYGHGEVYNSPSIIPYHVLPVTIGTQRYWVYAGTGKAYCTTITSGSAIHTDITKAATTYTGGVNAWTSALLGGVPIINNGVDAPQMWSLNPAAKMTDLSNWPAATTCKALRSFKQFLIAMNVTVSGVNYPFLVQWSHPADPGAVPSSWDVTDATKDAGKFDLAQGYDPIVDGLQLGDSFMVYKEASVWRLDFIGGTYIFKNTRVRGLSGALNRNCVVEVDGFHFVLTTSDVVVHDGQVETSVLDKQSRRFLFQNMDVDNAGSAFVFKNPFLNEVFVCYASIGSTVPDKALVWNYIDKTVGFRDIPNLYHANYGPIDNGLTGNWSQDSSPWGSDLTSWNGPDFAPSSARVLMCSSSQKLYMLDASSSFDGTIPSAYLERRGLSLGDHDIMKTVLSIRPKITGNAGESVLVKVGSSDDPFADPVYDAAMTHIIGSTFKNDCRVTGRYIAIRFETGTAYQWRLDSYGIEVKARGSR